MIFKISSRFGFSDSRYEKPFHIAICDKLNASPELQINHLLVRRKGFDRLGVRIKRGIFSYWGVAEILADGKWVRWYTIYKLSPDKPVEKKSTPLHAKDCNVVVSSTRREYRHHNIFEVA